MLSAAHAGTCTYTGENHEVLRLHWSVYIALFHHPWVYAKQLVELATATFLELPGQTTGAVVSGECFTTQCL